MAIVITTNIGFYCTYSISCCDSYKIASSRFFSSIFKHTKFRFVLQFLEDKRNLISKYAFYICSEIEKEQKRCEIYAPLPRYPPKKTIKNRKFGVFQNWAEKTGRCYFVRVTAWNRVSTVKFDIFSNHYSHFFHWKSYL